MQDVNKLLDLIVRGPLFLRLKDSVENNAYHDHEKVYDHLLKTLDVAKKSINGAFIKNVEAKKSFLNFLSKGEGIMKKRDLLLLIALLHDVGKILNYKEDLKTGSMFLIKPDDTTLCPGHEYWGSTLTSEFLKETNLSHEIINYIAKGIRLHGDFGKDYFRPKKDWPIEKIIEDVKAKCEGMYKEVLFNVYCDCFYAKPFQSEKEIIIKLFNEPSLYVKREYFIP